MTSKRRRSALSLIPGHIGILTLVVTLVGPLYYVLVSSVKTNNQIILNPFAITLDPQIQNFGDAIANASLGKALLNSAYITLGAELLTIVLALPAAFAIARTQGRLSDWFERSFALGFLIPGFAALVPTAMLAILLDLFHTREFLVLFLPATALPLSVILLVQAVRAVPPELAESAEIDGSGPLRMLLSVYLPLTAPTLATVAILNFLSFWNEYFFTLVIAGPSTDVRTAQVALPTLTSTISTQYGILSAGIVVTLLPVYAVYIALAKRMENAVLSGAVKG
ncbi:carbohydrate ABC transporter membrane protein 2 (CUT1 family) [Salana multivorans]|uniref:Carbohydrate ABC transporter membrane protein 2 (CUT1 family) n=1 Tax=Salana multivorans TaxID=120377 RepID=A0A3N2DBI7_9MICO|nr:carbohydrate ABC transporter permease [Salana multivorans]MBN8883508.1 carbohydrate ABC transporter permease [Salana multivorans]OJX96197.1 MAG: transporter [Micrococcales bacterium 73-15]ROR97126.1 carbohydrate ABC transporter membrane protein 2 (CUT1 family) [Salana multivorans]